MTSLPQGARELDQALRRASGEAAEVVSRDHAVGVARERERGDAACPALEEHVRHPLEAGRVDDRDRAVDQPEQLWPRPLGEQVQVRHGRRLPRHRRDHLRASGVFDRHDDHPEGRQRERPRELDEVERPLVPVEATDPQERLGLRLARGRRLGDAADQRRGPAEPLPAQDDLLLGLHDDPVGHPDPEPEERPVAELRRQPAIVEVGDARARVEKRRAGQLREERREPDVGPRGARDDDVGVRVENRPSEARHLPQLAEPLPRPVRGPHPDRDAVNLPGKRRAGNVEDEQAHADATRGERAGKQEDLRFGAARRVLGVAGQQRSDPRNVERDVVLIGSPLPHDRPQAAREGYRRPPAASAAQRRRRRRSV